MLRSGFASLRQLVPSRFCAFPVDPRTISSASTLIWATESSSAIRPDISLNRFSIAICPMRRMGCRTVVSAGVRYAAKNKSSNPVTDTSSGTRSPRARMARIAPSAVMSL